MHKNIINYKKAELRLVSRLFGLNRRFINVINKDSNTLQVFILQSYRRTYCPFLFEKYTIEVKKVNR